MVIYLVMVYFSQDVFEKLPTAKRAVWHHSEVNMSYRIGLLRNTGKLRKCGRFFLIDTKTDLEFKYD